MFLCTVHIQYRKFLKFHNVRDKFTLLNVLVQIDHNRN